MSLFFTCLKLSFNSLKSPALIIKVDNVTCAPISFLTALKPSHDANIKEAKDVNAADMYPYFGTRRIFVQRLNIATIVEIFAKICGVFHPFKTEA